MLNLVGSLGRFKGGPVQNVVEPKNTLLGLRRIETKNNVCVVTAGAFFLAHLSAPFSRRLARLTLDLLLSQACLPQAQVGAGFAVKLVAQMPLEGTASLSPLVAWLGGISDGEASSGRWLALIQGTRPSMTATTQTGPVFKLAALLRANKARQ